MNPLSPPPQIGAVYRHLLMRTRFQLPIGLLVMLGASFAVQLALDGDAVYTSNFKVTIVAAACAHLIGYVAYRRLDIFPGMVATRAILPTFVLSYSAVFIAVLLLRLDYGRVQAVVSFCISGAWYLGLNLLMHRISPYRLAVIPVGQANRIDQVSGVAWTILESPACRVGRVQGVVADLRADLSDDWERFVADCALAGMPVYHVKQILESLTGRVAIEHVSENTLGSLNPNLAYVNLKQIMDWVTALVLLMLLAPLFLVVSIVIVLDSPGPALFRQQRMGYRGDVFTVIKFRTMRNETAVEGGAKDRAMTRAGDSRVTRIGAFLRRTRIDELPQILNILRGEMSWIGPRPEALALSRWYETELPLYRYRHVVRPGVTGWAQVNQGHVTDLDEVLDKLHYDFYYIKHFSGWLDFLIVLKTVRTVLTGFGAK